jgi:hypothetical protein
LVGFQGFLVLGELAICISQIFPNPRLLGKVIGRFPSQGQGRIQVSFPDFLEDKGVIIRRGGEVTRFGGSFRFRWEGAGF